MRKNRMRVLVVEDDRDHFEIIQTRLAEPDAVGLEFEVVRAETLAEARARLTQGGWDVVLLDLMLPDCRGLDTFLAVSRAAPGTAIIVTTSLGDEWTAHQAMQLGAQDFLAKGAADSRFLKRAIRYAVERKSALEQRDQVIRAAADGMVVVDEEGAVRMVNVAAERLFELPADKMVGMPFPYPTRVGETTVIEIPRASSPPLAAEMRVTALDWHLGSASLACLRDLGEVRRIEELKTELEEQRRADEMKDEWIGKIAHELRTPLTIIKGSVVELSDGEAEPLQPNQAFLVGLARRQVMRVERLLLNLLEISRLESGRAAISRRRVDVAERVRMTVSAFQHAAAQRAIALTVQIQEPSIYAELDEDLFEQVVMNLLDNALRFARTRVSVRLECAKPAGVTLTIEDDGVGIPPEKQGLLFSKYAQLDRPRGPEGYKGTGLGLAICKEIVGLHRGSLAVESVPGRGTAFRAFIPEGPFPEESCPQARTAAACSGGKP